MSMTMWQWYRENRQRYFDLVDKRIEDLKRGKETRGFFKNLRLLEECGNKLRWFIGLGSDVTHGPIFCHGCQGFYKPKNKEKYTALHTISDCAQHEGLEFLCGKGHLTEEHYETD